MAYAGFPSLIVLGLFSMAYFESSGVGSNITFTYQPQRPLNIQTTSQFAQRALFADLDLDQGQWCSIE